MRAVRIIEGADDVSVQTIDAPELRAGGAIVRLEAALVAPYMAALPSGAWMTPPRPFIPGQCAIGVVEQSSGTLEKGQRVYFDAYTGSNDPGRPVGDHGFLGCFAVSPAALPAMTQWPDGSFAELIHAPETCFTPLPAQITHAPEVLCRLGWFGTALAGLERGGFRPGMRIAISGATGLLGTGAVALGLALGAGEVQVFGRRSAVLDQLTTLDTARVRVGATSGKDEVDMVLDAAGGGDGLVTEALIGRLRRYGTIAFVGGLTTAVSLDTGALMRNSNSVIGSFWFTPDMLQRLLRLIGSGALDLAAFEAVPFELGQIKAAIAHAQGKAGGLIHTALTP